MSHLPISYHDLLDPMAARYRNSGFRLHPQDFGMRHWPRLDDMQRSAIEIVHSTIGKDGFQVCLDVHRFAPNEITVKTIDRFIVVTGEHEERQDEHGFVARHFSRRYVLPEGFDMEQVVSQLSSDGVLTIKAPPPAKSLQGSNVRVLQIQHTGPAHLSIGNKEAAKSAENGDEKKH